MAVCLRRVGSRADARSSRKWEESTPLTVADMQEFQVSPSILWAYADVLGLQIEHAANVSDYVDKHAGIDESAISDLAVIATAQAKHPAVLTVVKDAISISGRAWPAGRAWTCRSLRRWDTYFGVGYSHVGRTGRKRNDRRCRSARARSGPVRSGGRRGVVGVPFRDGATDRRIRGMRVLEPSQAGHIHLPPQPRE